MWFKNWRMSCVVQDENGNHLVTTGFILGKSHRFFLLGREWKSLENIQNPGDCGLTVILFFNTTMVWQALPNAIPVYLQKIPIEAAGIATLPFTLLCGRTLKITKTGFFQHFFPSSVKEKTRSCSIYLTWFNFPLMRQMLPSVSYLSGYTLTWVFKWERTDRR